MKIRIILFVAILFASNLKGQTLKEATSVLKKLKNIEQIDALKKQYPNWDIYTDKTISSDSSSFPEIISAKVGDIFLKQYNSNSSTLVGRVIKEEDEELCKVQYIYLNGSKIPKSEIDSIRRVIIKSYSDGEEFESLVKTYTMDSNPNGDLGWFYKGMMVETFDSAVRYRKKDETFMVDVNENKWYYVVLKTYDNRIEKAKTTIMIKYN